MTRLSAVWLLFAMFCIPVLSRAQSPVAGSVVSVRQLSIPPKALHSFQKGVERLVKDDAAGSLPYLQRAVGEFPTYYEAYFEIGMANLKLSRNAEAEQALRKSIDLSGGQYSEPLFALGAALTKEEKFTEGVQVMRKALDLDPTSWAGHYCLGWALFALNRLDDAEKSVREALRWKPDSPEPYLLLADIHHHQQDYAAVLNDVDEYLKLEPEGQFSTQAKVLRDKAEAVIGESQRASVLVQPQP